MGSFRPNLEGMDLSSEVISLIERMLDMINDKDKKLSEMQLTIDKLRKDEEHQRTLVQEEKMNLAKANHQVEEFHKKEKQLTKKVQDQQKDIAEYLKLVDQLTSSQEKLKTTVDSLNTTIQSTVLRKLVEEWRQSGKWSELRRELKKTLDQRSKAHEQLCGISKNEHEPLKEVCRGGRVALLQLLLDAGLPAGAAAGGGDTMLHAAAAGGLPCVQLLLERGADVAARNSRGETPLLTAARCDHEAAVKHLLAWRADPGARDAEERQALHWVASADNLGLAKLLLDAGADAAAVDKKGITPSDLARIEGHGAMLELLLSYER